MTAGQSHDVWRVQPLVHGGSLTGVDDEKQLVVPANTRKASQRSNPRVGENISHTHARAHSLKTIFH